MIATLAVARTEIAFPGELAFSIHLENRGENSVTVLMDYAIHHQKKDGSLSPKVFKGKSLHLAPGATHLVERRHAFRPITTRVYHPGRHRIEILLNGASTAAADFVLAMPEKTAR